LKSELFAVIEAVELESEPTPCASDLDAELFPLLSWAFVVA
jgi:hypothetical protein